MLYFFAFDPIKIWTLYASENLFKFRVVKLSQELIRITKQNQRVKNLSRIVHVNLALEKFTRCDTLKVSPLRRHLSDTLLLDEKLAEFGNKIKLREVCLVVFILEACVA